MTYIGSEPLNPKIGGTGVSNALTSTITLGGAFVTTPANSITLTTTGPTNVTLPTSGTLLSSTTAAGTLTGTANQVLVNGTSGSPQTGPITLTTPQSIGTGSTVAFAAVNENAGGSISFGANATTHSTTVGSTTSTSSTTIQSGSGALNITSTNGAQTHNSGTGAFGISTDASATTVSLATGGAVKTVTLGSTNSTSVTTIACGTGGCNVGTSANAHATIVGSTTASATTTIQAPSGGVVLTGVQGVSVANKQYVTINTSTGAIGSDTGPTGKAGQFRFFTYLATTVGSVTGDGTNYTILFDTTLFDNAPGYSAVTGLYTIPAGGTGIWQFGASVGTRGLPGTSQSGYAQLKWSADGSGYYLWRYGVGVADTSGYMDGSGTITINATAGDTVGVTILWANGSKNIDVTGTNATSNFSSYFWGNQIA